jgi:predicted regulator of Ras-like GTPase activity (Roadblock/LC7/MglB family)
MPQVAELEDRIAKCNKILNENPNSQIFAALSEAYRKKGDVDKAFRVCQTGLKIHPDYGSAHMVMAKINLDKGLFDWAEMEVIKVIELEGQSHAADLLMAEILIGKGEYAKATKILDNLQKAGVNIQQVRELLIAAKRQPLEREPIIEKAEPVRPAPVDKDTNNPPETSQPAEPEAAPATINIKELLDAISEIPGVDGTLLINKEGLVADSRWDNSEQADVYGALACEVVATIKAQMDVSHFGDYENILVEAESSIINILPLKDNLLFIKANMQINLGTLRLKLAHLLERLGADFI